MSKSLQLDDVYTNLEDTLEVFESLIMEANYQKQDLIISWPNYQSPPHNLYYAREYEYLIEKQQYSFLLQDGSVIQIYYKFEEATEQGKKKTQKKTELTEYRLALCPYPLITSADKSQLEDYYCESHDETLCDLYQQKLLREEKLTNTSHIRFDYDSAVESHDKSELQIGAIKNFRLPFSNIIYPFVFFDFAMKNLFRKEVEYQNIVQSKKYKEVHNFSKSRSMKVTGFKEQDIYLTLE
jgi:hypothetical protein